MKTNAIRAAVVATLILAAAATPALAAGTSEQQEQTALLQSKMTLTEAIGIAEHQTGGKAFDAGVDIKNGQTHVIVETNGSKGVQTVTVDAQNGNVLGVASGGHAD